MDEPGYSARMTTPSNASQPDEEQPDRPKYYGMTKRAHIITAIVFGTVFLCCIGFTQGWWVGESEPAPPSLIEQAQNICYDAVLAELKAPSSAELVDTSAYPDDNDHWIVSGSVDAENSFGAMIRSEFRCDVQQSSGEQWQIHEVEIA